MYNILKSVIRGYLRELYNNVRIPLLLNNIEKKNPILIYQMGKVGSSTILHTLQSMTLNNPVFHMHTLSQKNLTHAIKRQRNSKSPYLHEHLVLSRVLIKKLKKGVFPCKIITVTREPVGRAISFVFEDLVKQAPEALKSDNQIDLEIVKTSLDELLSKPNGISDPSRWFDQELLACFGMDVFSTSYNIDQGYTIISTGSVSALVIRMEDIDRSLSQALSSFLDISLNSISLKRANIGSKKWYSQSLNEIKNTYRISDKLSRKISETRYFKHFYSEEEGQYLSKWE